MSSKPRQMPGQADQALAGSPQAAQFEEEEFFSGRGGIYHWSSRPGPVVNSPATTSKFLHDQW